MIVLGLVLVLGSTSLSKLVDNLSDGLHNNRCVDCKSCLDSMKTTDEKLILRCFSGKKNSEKDFNKELIKRFANTYNFCDNDHVSTGIIGKDLMKHHYFIKSCFIAA